MSSSPIEVLFSTSAILSPESSPKRGYDMEGTRSRIVAIGSDAPSTSFSIVSCINRLENSSRKLTTVITFHFLP